MRKALLLAATALLASSPAMARPITETDLATLDRLSSPAVSPDGRTVVYQLRSTDLEANKGRTDLWRLDRRSGKAEPLAGASAADVNEGSPAFSADGRHVYFLASVGEGPQQVWRVPVGGGAAEPVTAEAFEIAGFQLDPTGRRLAIWFDGLIEGASTPQTLGSARVYEGGGFVRHWDSWKTPGNIRNSPSSTWWTAGRSRPRPCLGVTCGW